MPASTYYVWEPPGHRTIVELSLAAVDEIMDWLERSVAVMDPEEPDRGRETGAILLGRRMASGAVAVDGFEEIPSEHRRGASFTLTVADQLHLGQQLERLAERGQTAVGYFRIHTRPGLYLDHDDDFVIRQYFAEPWQVVLLARPQAGLPSEAGFFFWDEGEMDHRQTVLPFPLDREALSGGGHIVEEEAPVLAQAARAGAAARKSNWLTIAGAAALASLGIAFIWGSFSRSPGLPRSRGVEAPVASIPRQVTPGSPAVNWPAPEEAERANAAAARKMRAPAAVATARPKITVKPRVRPLEARTEVTMEPVRISALRNSVGHIPLLGRLASRKDFVPARLRRKRTPTVPLELSRKLRRDEPVVVRVKIAKNGEVAKAELVSRKSNPDLASIAVRTAWAWDFEPARAGNKAVPSDMLVHFRFRPAAY